VDGGAHLTENPLAVLGVIPDESVLDRLAVELVDSVLRPLLVAGSARACALGPRIERFVNAAAVGRVALSGLHQSGKGFASVLGLTDGEADTGHDALAASF
jgi:hypothetical protein